VKGLEYLTVKDSLDGILEKWIDSELCKNKKMKQNTLY